MKISYLFNDLSRVLVILLSLIIQAVRAERLSEKIYTTIQSDHYCSRRMNATHQVGCQSDLGGNLGVVWMVEDNNDLMHVLKRGPTPPYIPILSKIHFTRNNLLDFKDHPERVSGVIFLDSDHDDSKLRSISYSPDDACPNRYSGLYVNDTQYGDCKHPWQDDSPVSGLLYDDIPFPIFLINDKKSDESIRKCFQDNNVILDSKKKTQASYPLCGIQLDSFMLAAKDSGFCLNSHFVIDEILQSNQRRCYTIDNNNIFAYYKLAKGPLHPINGSANFRPDTAEPQSIVMLAAKLSSLSMFSETSPGADSTITSIVTLLAVANALAKVQNATDVQKSKRNILFALLDSEPFDYTGSVKLVHDMMENNFPYGIYHTNHTESLQNTNLTSIDYLINLDQMANYPGSESIYFHSDPREPRADRLDRVYDILQRVASNEKIKLERDSESPLPPTSAHEFIKHARKLKTNQLTGLVLSNYGKTYRNKFYHSIYDDSHNIYQSSKSKLIQHLTSVSQFVARSLYELTFQATSPKELIVDADLISQLLDCYLVDAQCHLFTRACQAGQKLPAGPIQTYKDPTKQSDDINGIITSQLLAYFLGHRMPELNHTTCYEENMNSLIYDYRYVNDKDEPIEDGSSGVCIRSQLIVRNSDNPAYSFSSEGEVLINSNYPAWTVSLNGIRNPVRLYLIPSPFAQWSLLVVGLLVTLASFAIVLALKTKMASISDANDDSLATST